MCSAIETVDPGAGHHPLQPKRKPISINIEDDDQHYDEEEEEDQEDENDEEDEHDDDGKGDDY